MLNTRSPVSGTIWEGLGGVASLEMCHWRLALGFQKPVPGPVSISLDP